MRAAIYARKSGKDDSGDTSVSIKVQHDQCEALVKSKNWDLVDKTYADDGFSGATDDRPAFQRLLADVQAGLIDVVVVYRVDRFSRSVLDFASKHELLKQHNCGFVSKSENFDTIDPNGSLMLNILMSFAEFERQVIAQRTTDAKRARKLKGEFVSNSVPLGYELDETRHLKRTPYAKAIKYLFREFAKGGRSTRQMASVMTTKHPRPNGVAWTPSLVQQILKNKHYLGHICQQQEILTRDAHEALVDQELFDRVQVVLGHNKAHKRREKQEYLFSSLLICGYCGRGMSGAKRNGKYFYRCPNNVNDPESCLPNNMREEVVYESFLGELIEWADMGLSSLLAQMTDDHKVERQQGRQPTEIKKERKAKKQQEDRLLSQLSECSPNLRASVLKKAEKINAEIVKLELELKRVQDLDAIQEAEKADFQSWEDVLTEMVKGGPNRSRGWVMERVSQVIHPSPIISYCTKHWPPKAKWWTEGGDSTKWFPKAVKYAAKYRRGVNSGRGDRTGILAHWNWKEPEIGPAKEIPPGTDIMSFFV